jgi:hypothetical protein
MPYFVIMILLQIACVVHVFRNGRNTAWVFAIAFLPLVGIIAYFLVEILPGLRGDPKVRKLRSDVADKMDPERNVRAAREALAFSDTIANRMALGDALSARGEHQAARTEYRAADAKSLNPDAVVTMRLATAAMELGDAAEARAALARLPETTSQTERDRRDYLAARVEEGAGNARAALTIYEDIVTRMPGDEVRCRMAALYLEIQDRASARRVLEEVALRTRNLPAAVLREEREMYGWAKKTLAEL